MGRNASLAVKYCICRDAEIRTQSEACVSMLLDEGRLPSLTAVNFICQSTAWLYTPDNGVGPDLSLLDKKLKFGGRTHTT